MADGEEGSDHSTANTCVSVGPLLSNPELLFLRREVPRPPITGRERKYERSLIPWFQFPPLPIVPGLPDSRIRTVDANGRTVIHPVAFAVRHVGAVEASQQAQTLMSMPVPDGGGNAGPRFLYKAATASG